jgi:hypothetical protein
MFLRFDCRRWYQSGCSLLSIISQVCRIDKLAILGGEGLGKKRQEAAPRQRLEDCNCTGAFSLGFNYRDREVLADDGGDRPAFL